MPEQPPPRVGCYVDGFNLYFGLRDSNFRRFLWLDLEALAKNLALPGQAVLYTKYFTTRISGGRPTDRPDYAAQINAKRKRQSDYIEALVTHAGSIQLFEGHFQSKTVSCRKCSATWNDAEEKMTDVNIATEMLMDAFANKFDTALLISGDSDLVPPLRAVRTRFPDKRAIVAFPPGRSSVQLKNAASGQFIISKGHLKKSQLPDEIVKPSGHALRRPAKWR
jgi:uncharacterized LabA/DUF88 family protein